MPQSLAKKQASFTVTDQMTATAPDPKWLESMVRQRLSEAIAKDLVFQQYHDPLRNQTVIQTQWYTDATTTTTYNNNTTAWEWSWTWGSGTNAASNTISYGSSPQWVDAKPRRDPPPLAFNKFLNTSDVMEEYIKYLGEMGMTKEQVLDAPMDLFLKWLLISAAEADNEKPPEDVVLQLPAPRPTVQRCLGCGKFMKMEEVLPMHGQRCADFYWRRSSEAEQPVLTRSVGGSIPPASTRQGVAA